MPADDLTDATTEPLRVSGDPGDLAAEVEPLVADGPPVASAPGGWRRVVLGLLVGLAAGALLALVLPRRREVDPVTPEAPGAAGAGGGAGADDAAGGAGAGAASRSDEDHGSDQ